MIKIKKMVMVSMLTVVVACVVGSMFIMKICKPKIGDDGCGTMPIKTMPIETSKETKSSKTVESTKETEIIKETKTIKETETNNKKIETDSNTTDTESTKETSDTVELPFIPAS